MNIRKYFLITDTHRENPNPGDILICKGIEYLLREAENRLQNIPIFNYVNIFSYNKTVWERIYDEADYLIVCGTPQLNQNCIPDRFNQDFYDRLKIAKDKGIVVANLWVGFVHQDPTISINEATKIISKKFGNFITKNFKVYDLIVTRDLLTQTVLNSLGVESIQLIDSVYFSSLLYNISPNTENKSINLLVVRNIHSYNDYIFEKFSQIAKTQFDNNKSTIWLAHSIADFNAYKYKIKSGTFLCVNNPYSLMQLYSFADKVVSLRIHGSVLASYFGAKVLNINMDSRSGILEYTNIPSIPLSSFINESTTYSFKKIDINNFLEKNKNLFLNMFYHKCNKKKGYKIVKKVEQYVGSAYWTNQGCSNYGASIIKTPTQEILSDIISKIKFCRGLDLGCAGGYFVYLMNKKGKDFYGIDISSYVISEAKKTFKDIESKLYVSSIHDLSIFPDNYFDVIYSQQVLEHLPTELVPEMCKELYRICTPNAKLYLFLILGYNGQIGKADNDVDQTHINLKTKEWWDEQFINAGFEPIDTDTINEISIENYPQVQRLHRIFYKKVEK